MNKEKCMFTSSSLGSSVIATCLIVPGETVLPIHGVCVSKPSIYTVQIEKNKHLDPCGALWGFVNHSCHPNATIDLQRGEMIALEEIKQGEQIFWNYLLTEEELINPFKCQCMHNDCIGTIKGYRFINAEQRKLVELQRRPLDAYTNCNA